LATTVGSTTTAGSTNTTWVTWTASTATTYAATNTTWQAWNTTTTGTSWATPIPVSTAEQRERQEEEWQARARAEERAKETLESLLTQEQIEDLRRTKAFELITQSGRRYRIRRGVSGNVRLVEDGREVEALCAHPRTSLHDDAGRYLGALPSEDVMIAQMLALNADEEGFRRIANITPMRRPTAA
jgi:hypothetical protein